MRPVRKTLVAVAVLLAILGAVYLVFHEYVRATTFVVRAAGLNGVPAAAASWQSSPVEERDLQIPWREGTVRGRWYSSPEPVQDPTLLVPGVHAAGIDEPRLVGVARDLASVGHPVLTAELPHLKAYRITTQSTDVIEDAATWLLSERRFAPAGRIGIMGISFAGGLGIVAAGRESLRGRVESVMSFGGHGDLPRTLRYLCTGVQPNGQMRPPHDYGVAVILLSTAERVVPAEQVTPLREAILAFLNASHLDMVDKEQARIEFQRARTLAAALPEPAATLMHYVNERNVAKLGPILLPHVAEVAGDPDLSPSRSPAPTGVVYLLHGTDDNVIPAVESALLAAELRSRGTTVRHLTTPLITHAEVDRPPSIREVWQLVRFWGRLLDE